MSTWLQGRGNPQTKLPIRKTLSEEATVAGICLALPQILHVRSTTKCETVHEVEPAAPQDL